jgi:nucleoid-associated protein YgaU
MLYNHIRGLFFTQLFQKGNEMADKKKKNIFDKLVDAVSDRDEKEAAAKAAADKAAAEKAVLEKFQADKAAADKAAAAAKAAADKTAAEKAREEANKRLADARAVDAKQKATAAARAKLAAEAETAKVKLAAEVEAAKKAVIAEHKVGPDQTLSHISLKYYGSAAEPYWRLIYEANKDVIGANPGMIRPGMMLKIPVLPDELKK